MKITTFNPMIVSPKGDEIVALFESLGFEKRHEVINVDGFDTNNVRMKDANGFYVDVAVTSAAIPRDIASIRMNVDDFDEACRLLADHGFKSFYGDRVVENPTSRSAVMIAPSGFAVNLVQHIRK